MMMMMMMMMLPIIPLYSSYLIPLYSSSIGEVEYSDAFETQSDLESNSHRFSDISPPHHNTHSIINSNSSCNDGYDDNGCYDGHIGHDHGVEDRDDNDDDNDDDGHGGRLSAASRRDHHHHQHLVVDNRPTNSIIDYLCFKQLVMSMSDRSVYRLMYSSVCVHMLCALIVGR